MYYNNYYNYVYIGLLLSYTYIYILFQLFLLDLCFFRKKNIIHLSFFYFFVTDMFIFI